MLHTYIVHTNLLILRLHEYLITFKFYKTKQFFEKKNREPQQMDKNSNATYFRNVST